MFADNNSNLNALPLESMDTVERLTENCITLIRGGRAINKTDPNSRLKHNLEV